MSIEVRPLGTNCQKQCKFCYQHEMRQANTYVYQRDRVLASLEKVNSYWSLFGGEALLLRMSDLEELLRLGYERFGSTGVQTDGYLINERHLALFEKYKTHVGISTDGPGELNDARAMATLQATRKATERTHWAIRELAKRSKEHPHMMPSIIVVCHKLNFGADRFERFKDWIRELDAIGIQHVNLHPLELDFRAREIALTQDEYAERFIDLWDLQQELTTLRFTTFREITSLLQGDDSGVVCTWRFCDGWNTQAVQSIESDGSPGHCSRTNKDGQNWLPAEGSGIRNAHTTFIGHPGANHFERQLALYVSPQEHGGCAGCPFFSVCGGQCPGEGLDGDWRKRSSNCELYKRLFEHGSKLLREQGISPICDWEDRLDIEREMYRRWSVNESCSLAQVVRDVRNGAVAATTAEGWHADGPVTHGDVPHQDSDAPEHGDHVVHGDEHGDHTDHGGGFHTDGDYSHADVPHADQPHGDS